MANTSSAKKALKQNIKRNLINTARRSATRTFVKKVHDAIDAGKNANEVNALLAQAASFLGKAVGKDVMHKNTASRKLSRLTKKVKRYSEGSSPVATNV